MHGFVRDISEEGVGVAGIEAKVGDLKTLVILGDEFGEFSSFEFEAYCRWCYADEATRNLSGRICHQQDIEE